MTTPSNNPFYTSSKLSQTNGAVPMETSAQRMAFDNLLRRELRVGDPNDPKQIETALLARYKNTARAQGIAREAQGLPFLQMAPTQVAAAPVTTSNDLDLEQSISDIERDLQELTTNTVLKDVTPELQGWASAIRSAITEGVNAARFALDARQRDKALGIRRMLGDYARMARLVGTLTPTRGVNYRKLAQSLDEVAAVLLVIMGEALAVGGVSGGHFLLQVPYSELQTRRDTAVYALRNLVGATQEAYSSNEWPRGIDAYRKLLSFLDAQGQGDLRALLVENELARIMDSLIHRAENGRAQGLRALSSTAQLDLERFRRLIIIGGRLDGDLLSRTANFSAPPLAAFLEALQLFVDAFGAGDGSASGGYRLLQIARPPILFYGLYGSSSLGEAEERLLRLVIQRNLLADQLDTIAQFGLPAQIARAQVLLDKILYDVDRAIDLFAIGTDTSGFGEPERRAAAYHYMIRAFFHSFGEFGTPINLIAESLTGRSGKNFIGRLNNEFAFFLDAIGSTLRVIQNALLPESLLQAENGVPGSRILNLNSPTFNGETLQAFRNLMIQELRIHQDMENRWRTLVKTMAASSIPYSRTGGNSIFDEVIHLIDIAIQLVNRSSEDIQLIETPTTIDHFKDELVLPKNYEASLVEIAEHLDPNPSGDGSVNSPGTGGTTSSVPGRT